MNKNQQAFFHLVRAGLWEKEARLLPYGEVDYAEILRLAEEQAVMGLVTAGLKQVADTKVLQVELLQFIGHSLQIEEQNKAMNQFLGMLVEKMRDAGIHPLLVKGQGIAQCYEKPLWRSSGDIDFLLDDEDFEKAKQLLTPLALEVGTESKYSKHLGMTIDAWVVELHGNLRCGKSRRMDAELDAIKYDSFHRGAVRTWMNGQTRISMLSETNDAVFVFAHIVKHFYSGGIGLRQICDWCRLLWVCSGSLDIQALEARVRRMGMLSEWRAFGAFAVECLGMPVEAMPLYSPDRKWQTKAGRIYDFIVEVGNFGHNRDMTYYVKYPFLVRKTISLGRRCSDMMRHARIFPLDSLRFFSKIIYHGFIAAARGIS